MTTETQVMAPPAGNLLADLPAGRVLSGSAYDASVQIWNAAVTHEPALIVRPESPAEVQAAVLAARNHELALSVRGGGHDWAGRSLRHGGLVIDMSGLKRVAVDAHARVATVQGGLTAGEVIAAAQPHGLAAVTGTIGAVGITGLTLGGGYGPLNGKAGLALDNLLSAELVLADGRHVTATPTEEPELYWALRGGGGNFGVVTSLTLQLHHVPSVLAGLIVYPWAQAADVWSRIDEVLTDCPDELTVQTGVLPGPDGPTLFLSPVWSGQPSHGERAIDELVRLGDPLFSQVAQRSYADMLRLFDAHIVTGRHYAMRTRTVANYSPDVIGALVDAGDSKTSPLSGVVVHHFHGAATRVPVEETAFGIRRSHYMIEILAAWEPGDRGARHRDWTHRIANNLARHALPGGYPNMLGPTDHEQIAHAYGPNAPRLRAAKNRFDPDGIFSAIPLPPQATGYTQGQPGSTQRRARPIEETVERFDRREMLIVHDVLRREFALMRGLVATVALGDRTRAKVVGDHIDVLTSLLHHHHAGEESHVWPLLIHRCADSVAALTVSMHDQHEELAAHLDAVNAALGFWRADATADARSRLDDALHQLLTSLRKHLDDEERDVVPLMEQHITATEWDQMVQEGSADADPADLPLLFGMLMYEADPAITARVLAVMPDEARPVIAAEALHAFAEHSRALHGTPTPPRSTELTGSRHV